MNEPLQSIDERFNAALQRIYARIDERCNAERLRDYRARHFAARSAGQKRRYAKTARSSEAW
jgi:energy-coupling factor transporter ATP-binding protein EcfA2